MYFSGNLKKDSRFWLIEVPDLDLMTQGRTKKEAFAMIADAIELLIDKKGFKVSVEPMGRDKFWVSAKDSVPLMALFLKRQREAQNLSVREVAKAMNYRAHGSYAQYEMGKSMPGIDFIDRFIKALRPDFGLCLSMLRR